MYKVSVIIPTHNRGKAIVKSINSVINQTYKAYEIIIVNDGSTDDTGKIVEELQHNFPFIYYYEYFPNKGANYARNLGVKKSTGNFIAFLDDDDEWLEDKLEMQLKIFEENTNIDLVYTGVNNIYIDDNITYVSLPKKYEDVANEILLHNIISTTSTVCVKKSVLLKVGGFDENLPALQDYELWIRICQNYKIYGIREPLINYYNKRKVSRQISSNTENYVKAIHYILQKHKNLFMKLDNSLKIQKEIYDFKLLMNKEMRNNNRKQAYKYAMSIVKKSNKISNIFYIFISQLPFKFILKIRALKK